MTTYIMGASFALMVTCLLVCLISGFILFFLIYTFVFSWCFDKVFGLPASAMPIAPAMAAQGPACIR